jgi:hypothetical protein
MRLDQADIQKNLNRFQEESGKLHATANQYVEKKIAEETKMQHTIDEKKSLEDQFDVQKTNAETAQDRKRDMMNDRNKELLTINDKNLEAIKLKAKSADPLAKFLLERMACIINNDDNGKDFQGMYNDQLANAANFQLAVRSADGNKLSQVWMEEVRSRITGSDDANKEQGDMFKLVINEKSQAQNLPLFPFYRCLSKVWHMLAATNKMVRHQAKMRHFSQESSQILVKVAASKEKIDALSAFDVIKEEAQAIDENEVNYFFRRLNSITEQIRETEALLYGDGGNNHTAFADQFFK